MNNSIRLAALLAAATLALAGCAGNGGDSGPQSTAAQQPGGYPVTLTNCGFDVTLDAPPERIVLIGNDDVSLLDSLDALDLVIARTSDPVPGVYPADVEKKLADVELIASSTGETGGSVTSTESILATDPDLVLAPDLLADRQALETAGIPMYSPPAYCDDNETGLLGTATFDRVYDQMRSFGTMLGKSDLAEQRIKELEAQLADSPAAESTAVALYVPAGGGTLYPYGASSMVTPIFEAAGLSNVYADASKRVFEVNIEDLLQRDPETVVLLYSDGSTDAVIDNFLSVPGIDQLGAVQQDRVVVLPFAFTDPATPMSIEGVGKLKTAIDQLP